jgi:hypothetical protein
MVNGGSQFGWVVGGCGEGCTCGGVGRNVGVGTGRAGSGAFAGEFAGLRGGGLGGGAALVSRGGRPASFATIGGGLDGAGGSVVSAGAAELTAVLTVALEPREKTSHPIPTAADRIAAATRPMSTSEPDRGTPWGLSIDAFD